jgi:hypothetical protein|tara:strand:+ start:94 stop:300 length:207 start_codon:yes stop_codon:yes gene_type:complete
MKTEFKNVEWVFQFNNNNPEHLAEPLSDSGAKELTLTIGNTAESVITFADTNGNQFTIFAREKEIENL